MSAQTEASSLQSLYFRWLYDQVVEVNDPNGLSSYWQVCARMMDYSFRDLVEHDSNRMAEGSELRKEYIRWFANEPLDEAELLFPDVTIFEVLVALARRANLMIEMNVFKWFQLFLRNLGLDRYNDWYCATHFTRNIDRILDRFNSRTYKPNGHHGGLFPLAHPIRDQREVELWYQMAAFMTENTMY
jgi:hypothetical protein